MIACSSNCLISQEWLAAIAEGDNIKNATLLFSNVTSADDIILVLHYSIINWLFILGLSPLNQFFNIATHKNFKLLKNVVLDYW